MYTKILVALDGSPLSESVLPYARSLAKALKARVELLQAIDPDIISAFTDPEHGRYFDTVEAGMKQNSLDYLHPLAGSFPDPSAIDCSVGIGKPAEVIVKKAASQDDTLIAMATHGRSGLQRWLMGSVAEKVLRVTTNHLLLVRPTDEAKTSGVAALKTVLVPLDGSDLAEMVIPHVVALAKRMNLEVILLRVHSLLEGAYVSDEYSSELPRLMEQIKGEARAYLDEKVRQLKGDGLDKVSSILLEGDPAGEIIETARRTPDNLVAMCTHGRSGIGRWVIGSVTERVVRHSGDPVLVFRASAGAR